MINKLEILDKFDGELDSRFESLPEKEREEFKNKVTADITLDEYLGLIILLLERLKNGN